MMMMMIKKKKKIVIQNNIFLQLILEKEPIDYFFIYLLF